MEYRKLGNTGLRVSPLCLGTMQFGWTADERTSMEVLTRATEEGINFIDTADVYSRWVDGNSGGESERIIGKWLSQKVVPREEIVIATKVRGRMGVGPNDAGLSRRHIVNAVEGSLQRLGVDYIDLYQTHSPDRNTPIEETLHALDDLVRDGRVRYVGCSNYAAWELMQSLWTSDRRHITQFVSVQPDYSLLERDGFERELEAVCLTYGLGVIPYSPLARGFLTGKYRRDEPAPEDGRLSNSPRLKDYAAAEQNWEILKSVETRAKEVGVSPSQVALAWLIQRPSITSPIIGPRTVEQLEDNLGGLGTTLSGSAIEELDRVSGWE